jgi:ABC-type phosphate transport system permease subunit
MPVAMANAAAETASLLMMFFMMFLRKRLGRGQWMD